MEDSASENSLRREIARLRKQQKQQERVYDQQCHLLKSVNDKYEQSLKELENANERLQQLATERAEALQALELTNKKLQLEIEQHLTTQSELKKARDLAEEANEEKSAFLAAMSHEIRTPLHVALGMLGIVLEEDLPAEVQRKLRIAHDASSHLQGVIGDILDFSKIESGMLQLEETSFSFKEMARLIVQCLEPRAAEKGVELSTEVAETLSGYQRGDPYRVRQILFNLVDNAIKFTESGFVKLSAHLEPCGTATGTDMYAIEVQDSGAGIAPDKLQTIFERFIQLDQTQARRQSGSGLGLSICANLAEMMGGTIRVSSQEGKGSLFSVHLPFVPCPGTGDTNSFIPEAGASESLRILLVEDHPLSAEVAAHYLRNHGHSIIHAPNGDDALVALGHSCFDFVLMDVEMPTKSGIEVIREIRNGSAASTVPIFAMTAHTVPEIHNQCEQAGADGVMTKPVDFGVLNTKMHKAIIRRGL